MEILKADSMLFLSFLVAAYGVKPIIHNDGEPNAQGEIARCVLSGKFLSVHLFEPDALVCKVVLSSMAGGWSDDDKKQLEANWQSFSKPELEDDAN